MGFHEWSEDSLYHSGFLSKTFLNYNKDNYDDIMMVAQNFNENSFALSCMQEGQETRRHWQLLWITKPGMPWLM